jgi:hypothetical protein
MKNLLVALLAWLASAAPPSDGLKRERLPADVDFVMHIDVEGLKQTQLWKHVTEEGQDFDLDIDELDDIREEFGIDPLTDVRAITLYKVEKEEDTPYIRCVNPAYPEGMMLAILFMNMFAPLIDHAVVQANIRRRAARYVRTSS